MTSNDPAVSNRNDPVLSPALVIGAGLLGTSVGAALTRAGVQVHLTDAVSSHALVAASRGAGSAEPIDPALVRLVVVAVPPRVLAETIDQALTDYPNAVVTDVGSVKGTVVAQLRARRQDLGRYVGSHPMAGSHHRGPLTAHPNLFADRTWIITPHDTSRAHSVLVVEHLAQLCDANIVTMGAMHHDEAVAQVSHLPHLLSVLMGGHLTDVPETHLKLAGQGVRDVTRIAGSDPRLWTQIIAANSEAVRVELERVQADLAGLLANFDDQDALQAFLARGRTGVRLLPGKHGTAPATFSHVVVGIPDAPGALARLFADIEQAGVNVEDVRIDHDAVRQLGWLDVQVTSAMRPVLLAAMTAGDWQVRPDDEEDER